MLQDEVLMSRFADTGSEELFTKIYTRHFGRAIAYLRKHCTRRFSHLADEACQDFFMKLSEKRAQYDPQQPFLPWFYRLLMTTMADKFREEEKFIEGHVSSSHLKLVCEESSRRMDELLDSLDEESRCIVRAIYIDGKTMQEAANDAGLGYFSARRRFLSGLDILRAASG